MGRRRRGVAIALSLLMACAFGCETAPKERTNAMPVATATRAATTATAATAPRPVEAVPAPPVATASPLPPARPLLPPPAPTAPPVPATAAAVAPPPPAVQNGPATTTGAAAPYAGIPTAQPPPLRQPRAFRTPERAGDQAFIPPQPDAPGANADADGAPAMVPNAANDRPSSASVVFRASASAPIAGFDVRAAYPASLGSFAANGEPQCTGPNGLLITANDRGGELHLLVATAQTLPLSLDVFCRFTSTSGARVGAGDFSVQVAEVTGADAKRADPSLLAVSVSVR